MLAKNSKRYFTAKTSRIPAPRWLLNSLKLGNLNNSSTGWISNTILRYRKVRPETTVRRYLKYRVIKSNLRLHEFRSATMRLPSSHRPNLIQRVSTPSTLDFFVSRTPFFYLFFAFFLFYNSLKRGQLRHELIFANIRRTRRVPTIYTAALARYSQEYAY